MEPVFSNYCCSVLFAGLTGRKDSFQTQPRRLVSHIYNWALFPTKKANLERRKQMDTPLQSPHPWQPKT